MGAPPPVNGSCRVSPSEVEQSSKQQSAALFQHTSFPPDPPSPQWALKLTNKPKIGRQGQERVNSVSALTDRQSETANSPKVPHLVALSRVAVGSSLTGTPQSPHNPLTITQARPSAAWYLQQPRETL